MSYELETDGDYWGHHTETFDTYSDYWEARYYWESAGHGTTIIYGGETRDDQ